MRFRLLVKGHSHAVKSSYRNYRNQIYKPCRTQKYLFSVLAGLGKKKYHKSTICTLKISFSTSNLDFAHNISLTWWSVAVLHWGVFRQYLYMILYKSNFAKKKLWALLSKTTLEQTTSIETVCRAGMVGEFHMFKYSHDLAKSYSFFIWCSNWHPCSTWKCRMIPWDAS